MNKIYKKKTNSILRLIAFAVFSLGNSLMNAQDVGATALVAPTTTLCAANSQTVTVTIKNYAASTIDFSVNTVTVTVAVTGASTQNFTTTVSTGTLAAGATQNVTVSNAANMTAAGVHNFNASATVTGDLNTANDAMPQAQVTVNPLPTVTASGATVCVGQTINLVSSGGVTYSWSGPGAFSSSAQNPSISNATVSMNGTYTVTATDANGCVGAATATVTINPLPTLSIVGNSNICSGTADTLTAVSGASTFTWSANAGAATTTTVVVTPNATDMYTVMVTDANGCMNAQTITVNVTSTPTLNVTASNTLTCGGSPVTCTVTGASTYTWSANAGSANTSTVTVTPGSTATYVATGDNGGCTSSASIVITVNNGPIVTTSVTAAATCPGANNGSAMAMATGSGPFIYTWAPSGGNAATATGLSPGVYTVTVTDMNGCMSASTATIANPGSSLLTLMSGGNSQSGNMFNIAATNNTHITSFDCNLDTLSTNAGMDSVKIYYIPGSYIGQQANPGAWTLLGTAHVMTGGVNVAVPVPIPVNVTIPAGQTYGFYVTRITTTPILSLKYTNGTAFGTAYASNADFSVLEGNGVAYPFGTLYPSTGTAGPGSRQWNGIVHYCNTVGVEQQLATSVSSFVYPQPMIDQAFIKIAGMENAGTVTVKIFDVTGKMVKEKISSGTDEIKISRNDMNSGIYFYNIYNEEHKLLVNGKFVVE